MVSALIIIVVLFSSALGALGAMLIKKGTNRFPVLQMWRSKHAWGGVALILLSMAFYIFALQKEKLSVIYPLTSTMYIFATLLSVRFLGEKMSLYKWIALAGIMVGVGLIGVGG